MTSVLVGEQQELVEAMVATGSLCGLSYQWKAIVG
jgi:hypothetical protein